RRPEHAGGLGSPEQIQKVCAERPGPIDYNNLNCLRSNRLSPPAVHFSNSGNNNRRGTLITHSLRVSTSRLVLPHFGSPATKPVREHHGSSDRCNSSRFPSPAVKTVPLLVSGAAKRTASLHLAFADRRNFPSWPPVRPY